MAIDTKRDEQSAVEDPRGTSRESLILADGSELAGSGTVRNAILRRIWECVERVRLGFEHWERPHAKGPGLYFVLENGSVAAFTEPIGANNWPVAECASVFDDIDAFVETARSVARRCDGAVVVRGDGTIEEQMVRVKQLSPAEAGRVENLPYAGWMGTRHMSALETSTRQAVCAVITLSEEDGRMTVFTDGTFEDRHRDA